MAQGRPRYAHECGDPGAAVLEPEPTADQAATTSMSMTDLTATEVRYPVDGESKPTAFRFAKIPAMEAWTILEMIRVEVGRTLDRQLGDTDAQAVLRIIMTLRTEFIGRLREAMFAHVTFSCRLTDWQTLAGAEDTAFNGLEPAAVYDVLLRSLAVNFTESFRQLQSLSAPVAAPTTSQR